MAQCPVCEAPVRDDFGLVECESCRAQLIMHVDGRVECSSPAETSVAEMGEAAEAGEEAFEESSAPRSEGYYQEEPEFADPTPNEEQVEAFEPHQEAASSEFLDELPPEPDVPMYTSNAPDSPDLSDVANFGNSEASGGREGSLRYNLFVSGIDTSDVREEFREAITDRKFMWDTDQIVRSIRHGEVRIANVSPVKAYILISRLRYLPLQIRWEQYAIHQP